MTTPKALCNYPRNLDDGQVKALAQNGCVIGMSYVSFFVDSQKPTLDLMLDHIEHICSVAGIEAIGLGNDFDGGGILMVAAL